jgi:uncharacterized Zn finger protein (UPF0148 family)
MDFIEKQKQCKYCKIEFTPEHHNSVYCGSICRRDAIAEQHRKSKAKNKEKQRAEYYKRRKAIQSLTNKKASKRGDKYSDDEIIMITATVKNKYKYSAAELALELGRSYSSIIQKRNRLKGKKCL